MQKQKWSFWTWYLLLTWWVIWAGFFALPRSVYQAWVPTSILVISIVWILVTIIHLILAEVSLSVPGHKTFVWIARALLPHRLWRATSTISILNNFIWIIAYIILWWSFLQMLLWVVWLQIDITITSFIYLVFIWIISAISIKALTNWDRVIVTTLLVCMGLIILSSAIYGGQEFTSGFGFMEHFNVYGIALFALSSINTIPILYHSTWWSAIQTRNVIITSGFCVTILAILFALAIITISWPMISENGISGLLQSGHTVLGVLGSVVWLTAIISSHIPVIEHLQEIYKRDWHINSLLSWILLVLLPFIIILYFDINLIELLGITGSLLWGLLFIFVCLLNIYLHRTKQKIKIIPMIKYDIIRSRILCVLCGVWVLYQVLTFY